MYSTIQPQLLICGLSMKGKSLVWWVLAVTIRVINSQMFSQLMPTFKADPICTEWLEKSSVLIVWNSSCTEQVSCRTNSPGFVMQCLIIYGKIHWVEQSCSLRFSLEVSLHFLSSQLIVPEAGQLFVLLAGMRKYKNLFLCIWCIETGSVM